MSRRSSRLVSIGYYNPDNEPERSISYREKLFKFGKRRGGTHKVSNTSKRANSTNIDESQSDGLSHPLWTNSDYTMRTVTPQPALPPSSSQSQVDRTISGPPTLEKSSYNGLYSSSRPTLHLRPTRKKLNQSSGYSYSEETHRNSSASTSSNSTMSSNNGASTRNGDRISNPFFSMRDFARPTRSKEKTALANGVGFRRSSGMKKAYVVALPLIILLLLAWFFLPLLTSFICSTGVTKTLRQEKHQAPMLKTAVLVEAAARLRFMVKALAARQAKMLQKLLSIQHNSSPPPSSDPRTAPAQSQLTSELQQAMEKWLTDHTEKVNAYGHPMANKMADFALETQGATVITSRCSVTYRFRSSYLTILGFPLWYLTETPRTVIQGNPVLAGKCWPFHGAQGALVISLSQPIKITHVTLDHLPRYNSPTGTIASAPRDFEVYGMKNDSEEGTLLGTFTYDEHGEPTQTFKIPNASDEVYKAVELRVLNNWGNIEYTCLYRFRVHGKATNPCNEQKGTNHQP